MFYRFQVSTEPFCSHGQVIFDKLYQSSSLPVQCPALAFKAMQVQIVQLPDSPLKDFDKNCHIEHAWPKQIVAGFVTTSDSFKALCEVHYLDA